MERIYVFLIRNDVWIYILSALGLFWFGTEFLRARRLLQRAMFGLERERGARMRNNALTFIIIFAAIIGVVYYVNAEVRPTLPPELLSPPTPTPNIFATPLASPTPLGTAEVAQPTPTPPLVPTITLPGEPGAGPPPGTAAPPLPGETTTPAATAGPTITPFVGCTVDLNIDEPQNGGVISNLVSFSGTADPPDFAFYRLEANGPETAGQWASLLGRDIDQPVRSGFLGSVNLSQWESGPYLIRLVAFNTAGSEIGQCVIQVTLNNS